MLNLLKRLFGGKNQSNISTKPKTIIGLDNKKYMLDKEIPAQVEDNGYYNCGFVELEDGRKGWMLIPMGKYTVDKYRM